MNLTFEPRNLFKDTPDREGLLVTQDRELIALLIRLSDIHGEHEGGWYVEWACRDELASHRIFYNLDSVTAWISQRLAEISH